MQHKKKTLLSTGQPIMNIMLSATTLTCLKFNIQCKCLYAGTVMMSFYYAYASNWFQTNQPEHESDDCAGDQ